MFTVPTVLAVTLTPMRETLQEKGVDFAALAHRAGIDPDKLADPSARCPSAKVQRLWRFAADSVGDPCFGLTVGRRARPGMFHALGLGILSSTSLLKALERVERYSGIVSTNGRFMLVRTDEAVSLETRPTQFTVAPSSHMFDALVVALCGMLELCAGPESTPREVRLPHPAPQRPEAYRDALRCTVHFDAEHLALCFDPGTVARPAFSGNAELAAEADRLASRYLERLEPDSAAARVRNLLLKAMPSGELAQDSVARALHQSASTLQRRLRREGTTYQRLLDVTRRDLAIEYLRQGQHSLADITFLLGFADQSNFTRAFRRWTGKTPREYLS
jgi:AraC-like DNA-binding protein